MLDTDYYCIDSILAGETVSLLDSIVTDGSGYVLIVSS